MKKYLLLLCSLLLLFPLFINAQETASYPPVTLPNTEARILYSAITDQEYTLSVALPTNYKLSEDEYPVLYLLDPENSFGIVVNTVQGARTLSGRDLPELIIVGIGYTVGPEQTLNALKRHDYENGREDFLQFFNEELIPFIDTTYRTVPDERAIVSAENSGYFALYTLFSNPETFNRYIAVAPTWDVEIGGGWNVRAAVDRQPHAINDLEEAYAADHTALPVRLFLAASAVESPLGVANFRARLEERAYGGLRLTEHPLDVPISTIFSASLAAGLNEIYCDEISGCSVTAPVLQAAVTSYTPGEIFTTPDSRLSMVPSPGSFDLGGTCPAASEATILQIAADERGQTWLELECGRSSGWVKEEDLLTE